MHIHIIKVYSQIGRLYSELRCLLSFSVTYDAADIFTKNLTTIFHKKILRKS
jgi:hypothetical protein